MYCVGTYSGDFTVRTTQYKFESIMGFAYVLTCFCVIPQGQLESMQGFVN